MLIDTAASRREISKLGRKLTGTIVNSQISGEELREPGTALGVHPPPPTPRECQRAENSNRFPAITGLEDEAETPRLRNY